MKDVCVRERLRAVCSGPRCEDVSGKPESGFISQHGGQGRSAPWEITLAPSSIPPAAPGGLVSFLSGLSVLQSQTLRERGETTGVHSEVFSWQKRVVWWHLVEKKKCHLSSETAKLHQVEVKSVWERVM